MKPFVRISCPRCDLDFGQEAKFIEHMKTSHAFEGDFEALFVDSILDGKKPSCECGCGQPVKWNGWKKGYTSKFLRGHNATVDSIYNDPEKQKLFAQKRKKGYSEGKYKIWNDGLTKETDDRVKTQSEKNSITLREAYGSGKYVSWQVGLTKETDERLKKSSESRKGAIPWNKGLTKESDETMRLSSEKISSVMLSSEKTRRHKKEELPGLVLKLSNEKFALEPDLEIYQNKYTKLSVKCVVCEKISKKNLMMLYHTPVCFHCHPKESKGQLEVYEFVKSLCPDAVLSDRTMISPKELDVYVPSCNFAIEYNGLYWHSSEYNDDPEHNEAKLRMCEEKGISLLIIYEDEWREKKELIQSMIKQRLKLQQKSLYARSLQVKECGGKIVKDFFDLSHLEGNARSTVAFGLFDEENKLIACMSLRQPFHKKYRGTYEVARCAVLPEHNVPGWLGKLTKAAKDHCRAIGCKKMMTYVDSRLGSGKGYLSAGWKKEGTTGSPRFWWTDYHQRFNRFKFKADKTRNMTQKQIADEAGVVQIFGCVNSLWFIDV